MYLSNFFFFFFIKMSKKNVSRNYKVFLVTVTTAILGSLTTICLCVADVYLFYQDRDSLQLIRVSYPNTDDGQPAMRQPRVAIEGRSLDWPSLDAPAPTRDVDNLTELWPPVGISNSPATVFFPVLGCPVSAPAFLVSSVAAIMFAGIVVVLLMHLLVFHVLMVRRGITTYEYLRGYHKDVGLREAAWASERAAEKAEMEARLEADRERRVAWSRTAVGRIHCWIVSW